ncbi:MAG TPA: HAD family hydrolase [Candidatus Binatia bacterium]
MVARSGRKAVFLDRDGTLIREVNYLCRVEQIEILPGVAEALRRMRSAGFSLVMITNQSAVARGYLNENSLHEIHHVIETRLEHEGASLDAIYYCPHHPTAGIGVLRIACECRKPKTGMIDRAVAELGLDPTLSVVVGDQLSDMELASAVGARGVLLDSAGKFSNRTDESFSIAADLDEAARSIITNFSKGARLQ